MVEVWSAFVTRLERVRNPAHGAISTAGVRLFASRLTAGRAMPSENPLSSRVSLARLGES